MLSRNPFLHNDLFVSRPYLRGMRTGLPLCCFLPPYLIFKNCVLKVDMFVDSWEMYRNKQSQLRHPRLYHVQCISIVFYRKRVIVIIRRSIRNFNILRGGSSVLISGAFERLFCPVGREFEQANLQKFKCPGGGVELSN